MLAVEVPSSPSKTKPTPDPVVSNPIDSNVKIKMEEVTSTNIKVEDITSSIKSHHAKVEAHNNLQRRNRIFSIDLDPAGFDFESSMAVTFATPSSPVWNGASSGGDLPPIASLSSSNESHCDDQHLPPTGDDSEDHIVDIPQRDRIMSLDLSAFIVVKEEEEEDNEDNCAPPPEEFKSRPRGDSIIFDPMSFSDGGIHEEKALLRSSTSYFAENDEMELMNTPVNLYESSSTTNDINNSNATKKSYSTSMDPPNNPIQSPIISNPTLDADTSSTIDSSLTYNTTNSSDTHNPLTTMASSTSSLHTPTLTVVTSNTSILTSETGLPSAGVTTLPTQIVPSSLHGTIPLTTCPMELLNKGGRIGIYLPAARKARIAKFHSKRKMRIWRKRIKYDCRKKLADSRPRIKGRFVKRSNMDDDDELISNSP